MIVLKTSRELELMREAGRISHLALMAGVSRTLGEAAENLGASPLRSFLTVTLPLSLPAVSQAFLIIFLFAFGGYELPLLLGATVPRLSLLKPTS